MPELFQGTCRRCGHKTPVVTGGYFAVLVDEPPPDEQHEIAGAVLGVADGGAMAVANDPRFVVLRHPIESSDLARTGYSWSDLLWQGRYVEVTNVICRRCGTVFQHRRLAAQGEVGCLLALALGLSGGLGIAVWRRSIFVGLFIGCLLAGAAAFIFDLLARLYTRRRFAERAAAPAAERACPSCHAEDAQTIGVANRVTCPACHSNEFEIVIVGIS